MHRLAIVLLAVIIGAAAPARAWCEATCLAPTSTETHCPTHEPISTGKGITAYSIDNCPAGESARPTSLGRVELKAAAVTIDAPQFTLAPTTLGRLNVAPPVTTVFQRHTPLRI